MSASLDVNWRILDWVTYQFTGGYSNNNSTNESWATERTYYIANEYRGYDFIQTTTTSIPTIFRTSYNSVKHSILITD